MSRDHVANLIRETYEEDALGQQMPIEHLREVFCQIDSVRQTEWFSAGQKGLKAQFLVKVFPDDYNGETLIEVDGVRYSIYRTFLNKHDQMELYLERKGGA